VLRGAQVRSRENTLLRPDYFLVGLRKGAPIRLVTVECKGSHGRPVAQHDQLAKASAQVNAVVIGAADGSAVSPPSLLMATALGGTGGIDMRILDPEGDGVLALPGDRVPSLNGPVEQFNEMPGIPVRTLEGRMDTRPGFYLLPQQSEWFARVLSRTSAASLLAFAGDRTSARELLTSRQRSRVGADYTHPGTGVRFDTSVTLGGLNFVGTDHVFRMGAQRMEAFSGVYDGLRDLLARKDLQGYQDHLPEVQAEWARIRPRVLEEWGGVVDMDSDGALLGLRVIGRGKQQLQYVDRP